MPRTCIICLELLPTSFAAPDIFSFIVTFILRRTAYSLLPAVCNKVSSFSALEAPIVCSISHMCQVVLGFLAQLKCRKGSSSHIIHAKFIHVHHSIFVFVVFIATRNEFQQLNWLESPRPFRTLTNKVVLQPVLWIACLSNIVLPMFQFQYVDVNHQLNSRDTLKPDSQLYRKIARDSWFFSKIAAKRRAGPQDVHKWLDGKGRRGHKRLHVPDNLWGNHREDAGPHLLPDALDLIDSDNTCVSTPC